MLRCCCRGACGPGHRESLLGLPATGCFSLALVRAWLPCSGDALTYLRLICLGMVQSESAVDGREGLCRLSSSCHLGRRLQGPPPMTCSPGHQGVCPGLCTGRCGALLGGRRVSVASLLWFPLTCWPFLLLYTSASCMGIDMSAAALTTCAKHFFDWQCSNPYDASEVIVHDSDSQLCNELA